MSTKAARGPRARSYKGCPVDGCNSRDHTTRHVATHTRKCHVSGCPDDNPNFADGGLGMHLVSSHNGGDANSCQWTNCGDAQNVRTSHLSLHLRIHNHKLGLEVDHGDEEEDDAGLGNSVGQPGQEHLDENDVDEEEVYSGTGSGFGNGRKANAQDLGADITRDGADGSGKRRIKGYVVEKEDGSYDHLNVIVPRDDMKRFLTGSFTISLTMENDDSAEVDLVAGEKI